MEGFRYLVQYFLYEGSDTEVIYFDAVRTMRESKEQFISYESL